MAIATQHKQYISDAVTRILGKPPQVTAENYEQLKPAISRDSLIALLGEVLKNPAWLEEVAGRSYTHTLGFDKIVLLDPGYTDETGTHDGWKLRLHLWWPQNTGGVPMVEGMHAHRFNFTSSVMTGRIENQRFELRTLDAAQQQLVEKLHARIAPLSPEAVAGINDRLEIILALSLMPMGSQLAEIMGGRDKLEKEADAEGLKEILGMDADELNGLVDIYGRYKEISSKQVDGAYTHELQDMVSLLPLRVERIHAGQQYFHPHEHIHRLFNRSDEMHSTLLLTTPADYVSTGGSLQRPTYTPPSKDGEVLHYERQSFTPETLRSKLENYLTVLVVTQLSEEFFAANLAKYDAHSSAAGTHFEQDVLPRIAALAQENGACWKLLQKEWHHTIGERLKAEYPDQAAHLGQAQQQGEAWIAGIPVLSLLTAKGGALG